jgi:hypothetical protein
MRCRLNLNDALSVRSMQLPEPQIYHRLVFSTDGKRLIWCGREDPMVRVWDTTTGRQLREFPQPHGKVRGHFSSPFLAFSPDGKRMAFRGPNIFEGIEVLDVATAQVTLQIKDQKDCRDCAFSPNGKLLAAHSGNGGLRIWDAGTGKLVRELCPENRFTPGAYKFVVFAPDSTFLATGGHSREGLDVWDLRKGKLVCTVPSKSYFYSAAFAPDNQSVVCVEANGQPYLYNLVAEKVIYRFNPPERLCHFVTFTPDIKRVALIADVPAQDQKGGADTRQEAIYLYEVPGAALNPAVAQVDDAALEKLWADLTTDNDLRLQRVLQAFRAAPQPAIDLFRMKVTPVPKEQQAKVEQLIAELDTSNFTKRDEAQEALQRLARQFAPLLEARKKEVGPGEVRNRLTFVLNQMKEEPTLVVLIREQRVLTFLEQTATPQARELLRQLAEGAPQARLTVAARAALDRLAKGRSGAAGNGR